MIERQARHLRNPEGILLGGEDQNSQAWTEAATHGDNFFSQTNLSGPFRELSLMDSDPPHLLKTKSTIMGFNHI